MIPLTDQQKEAVASLENMSLSACPGSGKTRVILAKILRLAEEVVKTPRSIACITYTNAAVDEIETRLRQFGDQRLVERMEVATIHSFCLQFILRPYQWLIPEIPKSFRIISPQLRDFERIVESVEARFGRSMGRSTIDDYGSLRIDVNGDPAGAGIVGGVVTPDSARVFWNELRKQRYLDFAMILYYSYRILRDNSFVTQGLSSRFRWLLIDEFQDTTDLQLEIFRLLSEIKLSNFFLVGDPNQSIQGFAGARPDLGNQFVLDIGARTDVSLTGNFRSSSLVVNLSDAIIPRNPAMVALGRARAFPVAPQYEHCDSAAEAITDIFIPLLQENNIPIGNAAVLSPWWTHLIPIARQLRQFDVPVVGPGARPYKRSRVFSSLAEQLGACTESNNLLGLPGVEKALFRLINDVTGTSRFDVFSYQGRLTALSLVYAAQSLAKQALGGVDWLRSCSAEVSKILITHDLLPPSIRDLLAASVEEMLNDMQRNGVDLNNLQIADLGLFANPNTALKLTTLHNSKGREYEAVAIVHLNDGQLPDFRAKDAEALAEAKRLFYVGATRAKKILLLCSDNSNRRNPPSRFIGECGLF